MFSWHYKEQKGDYSWYFKELFNSPTLDYAKDVVLTPDPDNPNKFKQETTQLVNIFESQNIFTEDSIVLDFGCGMGRVSKEMVERFKCKVIGFDFNDTMVQFAKEYVPESETFTAVNTYTTENSVDICIAILCLQHAEDPDKELKRIYSFLKPGGYFILLNENARLVPVGVDNSGYPIWIEDHINVFELTENVGFLKINTLPYMNSGKNVVFYQKPI
jgi:ubiquinone/menaquinone biosynthesis C-methylase UbiE